MPTATLQPAPTRVRLPEVRDLFYGDGSLVRAIAAIDTEKKVFVVASSFAGELVERIAAQLGDSYAGVFDEVAMHVQRDSVDAALRAARAAGAESLISVGGGTAIDCTKAVALCLALDLESARGLADRGNPAAAVPDHVSFPTTLSGAEATALFGMTDPETAEKQVIAAPGLAPRTVVLDPRVAAGTPDWLWASSGMRAVDHAVESVLSSRSWPLQSANALEGLRILDRDLARSALDPADAERRAACQLGAWMVSFAIETAGVGLSHAIGHQLGPRFDLAHGFTSAIMLPHVMAFNADATGAGLERIAAALGWSVGPAGAVAGVRELAAGLRPAGVPTTLSEVGADWDALGGVADHVMADPSLAGNPKPVRRADVMALFEAAWE